MKLVLVYVLPTLVITRLGDFVHGARVSGVGVGFPALHVASVKVNQQGDKIMAERPVNNIGQSNIKMGLVELGVQYFQSRGDAQKQ